MKKQIHRVFRWLAAYFEEKEPPPLQTESIQPVLEADIPLEPSTETLLADIVGSSPKTTAIPATMINELKEEQATLEVAILDALPSMLPMPVDDSPPSIAEKKIKNPRKKGASATVPVEVLDHIKQARAKLSQIHKPKKRNPNNPFEILEFNPRDIMESMGVPFVALSKGRIAPIIYQDKEITINVSCHPPFHVASIYDWDIIILVASHLQEIINSELDIPPRTLVLPRHIILKSLYRHDGNKQKKDLIAALNRLKSTLIQTTIHNEDSKYDSGFSYLDSWSYTARKDVKEIKITLSQWLYDLVCAEKSLLRIDPNYFKLTSGFKKALYRIARKHVGTKNLSWSLSLETLYKKIGSDQEFKKFKYKLQKIIADNDIPTFHLEWKENEESGKVIINFISIRNELKRLISSPDVPDENKVPLDLFSRSYL